MALMLMRVLAALGPLTGLIVLLFLTEFFPPAWRVPLGLWTALPLPLGYWIGRKVARDRCSEAVVLAGLAAAALFAIWAYWDAFLGPSSRTESLSGLILLFGPLYQLAGLTVVLVAAWLLGRQDFWSENDQGFHRRGETQAEPSLSCKAASRMDRRDERHREPVPQPKHAAPRLT